MSTINYMWPSSSEYYNTARLSEYKPFLKSDKNIKKYIDLSVGFFGGCSYHPSAWEQTFKSIRDNFLEAPIVLIEDGRPTGFDYSDMASRYNATYIKEESSIYLFWPTAEQCWQYLQWIIKVADIAKTEWLVQLHPDNICNDRFSVIPPGPVCGVGCGSRSGVSNNRLPHNAEKYLTDIHPNLEMNGYGWCGGGCLHVPTFKNIMKQFTFDKLLELRKNSLIIGEGVSVWNVTSHEDVFIPFLFNMYGYPYRVWRDIEELNRGSMGWGTSAAFEHNNKTYYNMSKEQILKLGDTIQEQVKAEKLLQNK
jgi:hypothetical protein